MRAAAAAADINIVSYGSEKQDQAYGNGKQASFRGKFLVTDRDGESMRVVGWWWWLGMPRECLELSTAGSYGIATKRCTYFGLAIAHPFY